MERKYLTIDEIHARELSMLKFVDEICRKEKLTYWLSGGTLLGAVRHKGFIPWDDDVDLMMPRPDFERFLECAPRCSDARYAVVHPRFNRDVAMGWARVWDLGTGVDMTNMARMAPKTLFLDVFPVDALPADPRLCALHFKRVRLRDILLKCSRKMGLWEDERLKVLKRVLTAVTSALASPNTYANMLDRFSGRGDFRRAKYAGVCVVTHYGSRERMPIEVFSGSVNVTFCDCEFPAPVGWETYLRGLYGDYMRLPPEDQRHSDHNLRAWLVEP